MARSEEDVLRHNHLKRKAKLPEPTPRYTVKEMFMANFDGQELKKGAPIKASIGDDYLRILQVESQVWRCNSFPPEHRTAPLQALGVAEESGELAHAVLKMEQGIRGTDEEHLAEAADAMGDIIIYLCGLATSLDLDLSTCVRFAWNEVKQRDWSVNKEDGVNG